MATVYIRNKMSGFSAGIPAEEWDQYGESDKALWDVVGSPQEIHDAVLDRMRASFAAHEPDNKPDPPLILDEPVVDDEEEES